MDIDMAALRQLEADKDIPTAKVIEVDATATSASATSETPPAFQRPEAGRISPPVAGSPPDVTPRNTQMREYSPPPANLQASGPRPGSSADRAGR